MIVCTRAAIVARSLAHSAVARSHAQTPVPSPRLSLIFVPMHSRPDQQSRDDCLNVVHERKRAAPFRSTRAQQAFGRGVAPPLPARTRSPPSIQRTPRARDPPRAARSTGARPLATAFSRASLVGRRSRTRGGGGAGQGGQGEQNGADFALRGARARLHAARPARRAQGGASEGASEEAAKVVGERGSEGTAHQRGGGGSGRQRW